MRCVSCFRSRGRQAFTLIELLIVVAIIAILAAVAVPNFLEAQTRAKVSRVENDMRTLSIAMEMYRMDNRVYIPHENSPSELNRLTSPVAYISTTPTCPFAKIRMGNWSLYAYGSLNYHMEDLPHWSRGEPGGDIAHDLAARGKKYLFWSIGPDLVHNFPSAGQYDATNGTKSAGDIYRAGP